MSAELWVGTESGNVQLTELHVGTPEGNVELTELWVGTESGNVQIFAKALDAVTGLGVTTLGVSSLRVSWSAVSGAAGYKVERSPNGSSSWSEVQDTASLTWDDTGLSDGTRYYYRVRAYSGAVYGGYSSVENAVTTIKAPSLTSASRNSTTPTSAGDLVFSDGGSVSESEIRIYVSTTGSGSGFSLWATTDPNDTAETISGLPSAQQVWVKLRNYNAVAGESADSSVLSFTTAPAAPSWASGYPQDNASDDDGILLRLQATAEATSYDVYYRVAASMGGDPTGTGTLLGNFSGAEIVSGAHLHSTGQAHGTTVYYQARARDGVGPGPFGSEASATVAMRVPGVPQNVAAEQTAGTATVTWDAGSPDTATTYRIRQYYRTEPEGSWTLEATFTGTSGLTRELVDGRQYYWDVRGENAAGNSDYSDASDLVLYTVTPGTPTVGTLSYDGTNPDSELVLSWTPPGTGTVDSYDLEIVEYSVSFSGSPNFTASGAATSSKRMTALADDTRYKARVRAVNDWGGAGDWSGSDDEWTAPSAPGAFDWSSGWPKATADNIIEFKVGASSDADEYEFHGGGSLLTTQAGLTYEWTGRSPNTQYTGLKVRARNPASGGSPHSPAYSDFTSEESRYTLVDVPQSFNAVRDAGECPANVFDLSWSNNNPDGAGRSEQMTIERNDGSGYSVITTTVTAGATSYRDTTAVAGTTGYRIKYSSKSTYATDTSLGPPCPE